MKKRIGITTVALGLLAGVAHADCNFIFVNKSSHAVTMQGYFLEDGDGLSENAWINVAPTRQIMQVRSGKKCNAIYKHTGQVATRVNLKNNSGYWIGNKGFIFAADRSYSHINGDHALADDGTPVTLSNSQKISGRDFKVYICEASVDADDCD